MSVQEEHVLDICLLIFYFYPLFSQYTVHLSRNTVDDGDEARNRVGMTGA